MGFSWQFHTLVVGGRGFGSHGNFTHWLLGEAVVLLTVSDAGSVGEMCWFSWQSQMLVVGGEALFSWQSQTLVVRGRGGFSYQSHTLFAGGEAGVLIAVQEVFSTARDGGSHGSPRG